MGKRRWASPRTLLLLLLLVFFMQLRPLCSQEEEEEEVESKIAAPTCNSKDLKALRGFMAGLKAPTIQGWNALNDSSCCRWPGIVCNGLGSVVRVVELNLTGKELNGPVSDSLVGLKRLRILDLSNNSLTGALPADLFRLSQLQVLDLSLNQLAGGVPPDSYLPSIRSFNISNNSFNGSYPLLTGSANLTHYDVSSNRFTGAVIGSICNSSPTIQSLRLSTNMISGDFPVGLGNCRALHVLNLNSNRISGTVPEDLFALASLKELSLQENLLGGEVSARIGNLSNLVSLDLSSNSFSGEIPDVFGNLSKLETFSASSNRLRGVLPSSLSKLSALRSLTLKNNSLDGEIGLDFKAMKKLSSIDLGSNLFSGVIPDALSSCSELRMLNLARNRLVGGIPESFSNLKALSFLSLSNNSFSNISSALTILQHCPRLSSIVLTKNPFHGETLSAHGIRGFKNLSLLVVASCGLVGPVPAWLSHCGNLQLVDLSWNSLSGSIPTWFGNLDLLFYLDLSNNSLSGDLPVELTGMKSLIRAKSNIKSHPADLPFFTRKNENGGQRYNQLSSFPPSLFLSHNSLVGSISPLFRKLKKLHVFDLSHNNLTGTIPEELSGMTSLERLDLSYNHLFGSIPSSLGNLSFLSTFNVAYNNLSGRIPTGVQFSTFTDSSFAGNPGLCVSRQRPCNGTGVVPSFGGRRKSRGFIIGMSLAISGGTVIVLALLCLVFSKAHSGRVENTETAETEANELLEYSGPSLAVLFQNKDGKDITINDILTATNDFDQANIIGCGGFGLVYRGTFPDGREVAIKRLSGNFGQMDKEFQAEVQTLSRAEHENLVMLQGFCRMGSVRILIYSYMENGSLDFWLHERQDDGASALDWATRLGIARGSARGLQYLHQSCQPHILHRDIKSSNILLDEKFKAHLADFGLARLIRPYDTHVTTDLVGTLGYIPPEYGQTSVATFKGDIYSFGVVLLELLTGRRPMDMCQRKGRRELVTWVLQMKEEGRAAVVFDPCIYDKQNEEQLLHVLDIACRCVGGNPKDRPLIQHIVSGLDFVGSTN